MLHSYNFIQRLDTVSQRYYKEFNIIEVKNKFDPTKVKEYTPCLQALFSDNKDKVYEVLNKEANKLASYLENGPKHRIFDTVAFLVTSMKA